MPAWQKQQRKTKIQQVREAGRALLKHCTGHIKRLFWKPDADIYLAGSLRIVPQAP